MRQLTRLTTWATLCGPWIGGTRHGFSGTKQRWSQVFCCVILRLIDQYYHFRPPCALFDDALPLTEWDGPYEDELYSHTGDDSTNLDKWENENLNKANPETVQTLMAQLKAFFQRH
jgi:hypothetical protein